MHPAPDRLWRSAEPKAAYDVVIVGAGGHGLATAYYLATVHGVTDVCVVEKGWLGGGNTARNTTIIRSNYLWDESAGLYEHSLKLWEGLEEELEWDLQFSQRGVLNLAHDLGDVRSSRRRVEANRLNGVDAEWLDAQQVNEFWGQGSEACDEDANKILSGLKGLMHNKYSDIILLCSMTAAFCMLLAFSATG